jgi:hypothetical protein
VHSTLPHSTLSTLQGTFTLQLQLVTRHLMRLLETIDNITTLDFVTYGIQVRVCGG